MNKLQQMFRKKKSKHVLKKNKRNIPEPGIMTRLFFKMEQQPLSYDAKSGTLSEKEMKRRQNEQTK